MERRSQLLSAAMAMVLTVAAVPALSVEPCGLCAREVAINPLLAACLLERYAVLATRGNGVIAVDLSDCERDRGIVASLPSVGQSTDDEPDLQFMLSRAQLDCLKIQLEKPGLVRDPLTRIDLGGCE